MKQAIAIWTLMLALCALALPGCKEGDGKGDTGGSQGHLSRKDIEKQLANREKYPILWSEREYQDIHESAKQAWWLTETAYFVVKDKFDQSAQLMASSDPAQRDKGTQMRTAVSEEIDRNIFGVNAEVEGLFLDAIAQQPDNPLNYATYALYLKARKRYTEGASFNNTRPEALVQVDKAIELWPDDPGFYMLKAYIIAGPDTCHEWFRAASTAPEELSSLVDKLRECYTNAEKYYPDNAYINYARAIDVFRYTPPEQFEEVREEILREIANGNAKGMNIFYHGPPVQPFAIEAKNPKLFGTEQEAIYTDQWKAFGHYDLTAVDRMVTLIGSQLKWPEDKETAESLMFFLYRLGHTQPYDRSFFSLQTKILVPLSASTDDVTERTKLQTVLNFLNAQYREAAQEMFNKGYLEDGTKIDGAGVNYMENGPPGLHNIKVMIQPRQGAVLVKAEEQLGMEFPLPEDRLMW